MSLLQMSFSGGILILAITVLRALALHKLPKQAFCILWTVAALRLLVPVSIPSPVSVYTLAEPVSITQEAGYPDIPMNPILETVWPAGTTAVEKKPEIPVRQIVWTAGSLACTLFFTASYVWCRRRFRESLPVDTPAAREWLANCPLWRRVDIRQCGAVSAPLTYGIFRPVILLPRGMDWGEETAYVLEHELVHIQRFDAAWKLAFAAAVCVHWFNPLVWVMHALANRDIELRCDETVVRRFGLGKKSAYALTLIGMEETRTGLPPMASSFSRNAIEERITAIMKLKKRSIAAVILAAVLVCGLSVGFATSAAEEKQGDLRQYLKEVPAMGFTQEESQRLLSLWFDGYEDMTVADYQQKMWKERDKPGDMELLDRFSQSPRLGTFGSGKEDQAWDAYSNYFFNVYEPLTASRWQSRDFSHFTAKNALLEYVFTLHILDAETLTVGEYERAQQEIQDAMADFLLERTETELRDASYMETFLDRETTALTKRLSTGSLQVQINYGFQPIESDDLDDLLYAEFSETVSQSWDELLSPYTDFGLTYAFDDADNDGNGLTMYYQGREVRGIMDEQENIWITEHTGNGIYSADAIELYAVYKGGKLTGLRQATSAEQAEWDRIREQNSKEGTHYANTNPSSLVSQQDEEREFPHATAEDYASFLTLMDNSADMALSEFNRLLLDWGNEYWDAYNRIMCDSLWNDYAVELSAEEERFVSLTCNLSGTENAMLVRSIYTGNPEEDPGLSANLPERMTVENGITVAWCDLFYQCSYHIADKSAVTVQERDRCIGGLMTGILEFWNETGIDALLRMTEEEVAGKLNSIAEMHSTGSIRIIPITTDDIHFEVLDERGIN